MGLGPQVVGILNDVFAVTFGQGAIRYSLLIVGLAKLRGSLHSMLGARTLVADTRAAL